MKDDIFLLEDERADDGFEDLHLPRIGDPHIQFVPLPR